MPLLLRCLLSGGKPCGPAFRLHTRTHHQSRDHGIVIVMRTGAGVVWVHLCLSPQAFVTTWDTLPGSSVVLLREQQGHSLCWQEPLLRVVQLHGCRRLHATAVSNPLKHGSQLVLCVGWCRTGGHIRLPCVLHHPLYRPLPCVLRPFGAKHTTAGPMRQRAPLLSGGSPPMREGLFRPRGPLQQPLWQPERLSGMWLLRHALSVAAAAQCPDVWASLLPDGSAPSVLCWACIRGWYVTKHL
jgi:hypothetical protein